MLTSSLLFAVIINKCLCLLQWQNVQSGVKNFSLPPKSVALHPNTRENFYFCRVAKQDDEGGFIVGYLQEDDTECRYPNGTVGSSSGTFEVLTKEPTDQLEWKFVGRKKPPPANAVPCDPLEKDKSCFLGMSVYSDGICFEALGFISSETRRIQMVDKEEVEFCPFYLYLVNKVTNNSE